MFSIKKIVLVALSILGGTLMIYSKGARFETAWAAPSHGNLLYHRFTADGSAIWMHFDNDTLYKYSLKDGEILYQEYGNTKPEKLGDFTSHITINSETEEILRTPKRYVHNSLIDSYFLNNRKFKVVTEDRETELCYYYNYYIHVESLNILQNYNNRYLPITVDIDENGNGYVVFVGTACGWESTSTGDGAMAVPIRVRYVNFYKNDSIILSHELYRRRMPISQQYYPLFNLYEQHSFRSKSDVYIDNRVFNIDIEDWRNIYNSSNSYSILMDKFIKLDDGKYQATASVPNAITQNITHTIEEPKYRYIESGYSKNAILLGKNIHCVSINLPESELNVSIPEYALIGEKIYPKHNISPELIKNWKFGSQQSEATNPVIFFDSIGEYEITLTLHNGPTTINKTIRVIDNIDELHISTGRTAIRNQKIMLSTNDVMPDQDVEWIVNGKSYKGNNRILSFSEPGPVEISMHKNVSRFSTTKDTVLRITNTPNRILKIGSEILVNEEHSDLDHSKSFYRGNKIKYLKYLDGHYYLQETNHSFVWWYELGFRPTAEVNASYKVWKYDSLPSVIYERSNVWNGTDRFELEFYLNNSQEYIWDKRINNTRTDIIMNDSTIFHTDQQVENFGKLIKWTGSNPIYILEKENVFIVSAVDSLSTNLDTIPKSNHYGNILYQNLNNKCIISYITSSRINFDIIFLDELMKELNRFTINIPSGLIDSIHAQDSNIIVYHHRNDITYKSSYKTSTFRELKITEPWIYNTTNNNLWIDNYYWDIQHTPNKNNPNLVMTEYKIYEPNGIHIYSYLPEHLYYPYNNLIIDSDGNFFVSSDSMFVPIYGVTPYPDEITLSQDNRSWVKTAYPISVENNADSAPTLTARYDNGIINLRGMQAKADQLLYVSNTSGRIVYQSLSNDSRIKINLAPGMYLVRRGNQTAKLVVN